MSILLKSSQLCNTCMSRRGKAIWDDNEHCFACGEHKRTKRTFGVYNLQTASRLPWTGDVPEDYEIDLFPEEWKQWLRKYPYHHIDGGFYGSCGYSKSLDRMVFPIEFNRELKCYQARSLTREPKWLTCSPDYEWGKKFPSYVFPNKKANVFTHYVIVEDIISAIVVGQVIPCISILGTNVNRALCNFLLRFGDRFIIWMDNDEAGEKAVKKLKKYMQLCASIKIIRSLKDPKYYTREEIQEKINEH